MKGKITSPHGKIMANLAVLAMGLTTFVCLFPPEHYLFIQGSQYAAQLLLFMLAGGIVFILLGRKTLLISALVCAGILALYLKESGNSNLKLAVVNEEPGLSVSVVNLTSIDKDPFTSFDRLLAEGSDIIAFQEVTPDWRNMLVEHFKDYYPYEAAMIRLDPFGQLIFSKFPIRELDTFYSERIPALSGLIDLGGGMKTELFSLHLPPAFDLNTYRLIREHLKSSSEYIGSSPYPSICLGDFQSVPWSQEIQSFRYLAGLEDSRRSFNPIHSIQTASLLSKPLQHIFYSGDLECTAFREIQMDKGNRIGLSGYYQRVPIREYISSTIGK